MRYIAELLGQTKLEDLALPSNLRYGQAIYKRGGVEIIKQSQSHVESWIGGLPGKTAEGGGQRRRVKLSSTAKGLAWYCSGNPKNHQIFCKHCIALALTIQAKS